MVRLPVGEPSQESWRFAVSHLRAFVIDLSSLLAVLLWLCLSFVVRLSHGLEQMTGEENPYKDKTYFESRFSTDPSRDALWRVLCAHLERDFPGHEAVLELGGAYCNFINNVNAGRKHVVDLFPDLPQFANPDVIAHVQSCTNLDSLPAAFFDVVFASNLLEHLTREETKETLKAVLRVLKPGGRLLLIQPNFRLSFRRYFDDYTHIQIFTDTSLQDLLNSSGFACEKVLGRFLPFSLKTTGPKWPWLLRFYLLLPVRPFAGQMYIVARPKTAVR
jgi:SAM-dependent methyltransferase